MNKSLHTIYVGLFFLVGISVTILLGINGYQYYSTPLTERVFDLHHKILKPSGLIGHGLGIIGTLMMIVGVSIYMIRKRSRRLVNFGYLKYWLELHIFLCSVGPVLVLFHTAFKFGGIVAISFWSMLAVVLSGVIGRFIYIQIPHSIQGQEFGINELNEFSSDLSYKLKKEYNLNENDFFLLESNSTSKNFSDIGPLKGLLLIFTDFLRINRELRAIKKKIHKKGVSKSQIKNILKVVKSKLILNRRIGMLKTMQKLFRYWHIVHLPFAITMFVIMLIHVAVTIIFGYKWIF